MKIVDLSFKIESGAPVFPAHPKPAILPWSKIEIQGFYSNVLFLSEHTLTHVDVPAHFVKDAPTVDEVPLEKFIGEGVVLDFSYKKPKEEITLEDLNKALEKTRVEKDYIVLLYTGFDKYIGRPEYFTDYVGLSKEAAEKLVEIGVKAVGLDTPSIDRPPFEVHPVLLSKGIVIYECLTGLDKLLGKKFKFIGLPLKIAGGSASPVRAVAVLEE